MTRASDTAKLLGAGATILDGTTISTADNTTQVTLKSTDADGNSGPELDYYRLSASPADNDYLGRTKYIGRNDNTQDVTAVDILARMIDVSDGEEDATYNIRVMKAGSLVDRVTLNGGETILNEGSADIDFRVESNGNANMLIIDGGDDVISIGAAKSTSATVKIQNKNDSNTNTLDLFNDNGNRTVTMQQDSAGNAKMRFQKNDGTFTTTIDANLGGILFGTDTGAANTLDDYEEGTWTPSNTGNITVNAIENATYTKIGRQVTVSAWLKVNITSANGILGGLPFQVSGRGTASISNLTQQENFYNQGLGSTIYFYGATTTGTNDDLLLSFTYDS